MKIAGVGVDLENLPTREQMMALAINTFEYIDNPNREEEINKLLDESGFWNSKKEEDGLHSVVAEKARKTKRIKD